MPVLRSGLVIAGGYADKIRRVLFAQMKDQIKSGEIDAKEVARAAGELNRLLYIILVDKLKIDKGDVVRITVEYDIGDGKIVWKLETLQIQAWRRVPEEEIDEVVKETVGSAREILESSPEYEVEKLGETDTGDIVFEVKLSNERVGAILLTPLNGNALVRAAFTAPAPRVLKKSLVNLEGRDPEEYVKNSISDLLALAEDTEKRTAERVMREILSLIEE